MSYMCFNLPEPSDTDRNFLPATKTIGVKSQLTKLSPRPKHLPKPIRLSTLLRLVVWELLTEGLPPNTRTDIFACAISHAGISSISSYWGGGYWGYGYSTNASAHAFPWNRKDIYVDQSPLFNADQVKVPILLIHGTKDVNVPTNESIQFYTALKLLGKDVELVLVKDADHAVVDYNQRILWNNTILSYFAKYLKDQPAWWEHQFKELNL